MSLVQISKHTLCCDRVPIGQRPVFQLDLEPHEQIVSFWTNGGSGAANRKTEDHVAFVWVANRLGEAADE